MTVEYQIRYRETGETDWTYETGITALSDTISTFAQDLDYEAQVQGIDMINGVGHPSPWSTLVTFSTPPGNLEISVGTPSENDSVDSVTVQDNPPVITLLGASTIRIPVGGTWTDPGATASDDVDGDLTGSISVNDPVDVNTAGFYEVEYSVTDSGGNTTTEIRNVEVAPVEIATSFNIRYRSVDDPAYTYINGETDLAETLINLIDDKQYFVSVEGVSDSGAQSGYPDDISFTTVLAAHIELGVGTPGETDSVDPVAPNIDSDNTVNVGTPVETDSVDSVSANNGTNQEIGVGGPGETDAVESVTPSIDPDNTVSVGSANETDTVESATAQVDSDAPVIEGALFDVEIENLFTNQVTLVEDIEATTLTEALAAHTFFRFRVQGKNGTGSIRSEWSDWSQPFMTHATPVYFSPVDSGGATDIFWIGFDDLVTANDVLDFSGTVSDADATVSLTIDGQTYTALNIAGNWYVDTPYGYQLGFEESDELKTPVALKLNASELLYGDEGIRT